MLIRCGYEITLTSQQPVALVRLLSVQEDHAADTRPRDVAHYGVAPATGHDAPVGRSGTT